VLANPGLHSWFRDKQLLSTTFLPRPLAHIHIRDSTIARRQATTNIPSCQSLIAFSLHDAVQHSAQVCVADAAGNSCSYQLAIVISPLTACHSSNTPRRRITRTTTKQEAEKIAYFWFRCAIVSVVTNISFKTIATSAQK
jgi:hypothetical protein